jgi:hypothetical protein
VDRDADAVEDAFGAEIDYAMLVKLYGSSGDNPEARYSPATRIGCRTRVLSGIRTRSTSRPVTLNGRIFRCEWGCAVSRGSRMDSPRSSRITGTRLPCTPCTTAIAACIPRCAALLQWKRDWPDHVWTLAELCALLPERKPNAKIDKEIILKALQRA